MKKIFLICFLTLSSLIGFSQVIVNRAGPSNTPSDDRIQAKKNLYAPRYTDTTQANITNANPNSNNIGIDSCGAIIYTRTPQAMWYRACNPKRWMQIVDSANLASIINNSINNISILDSNTFVICNGANVCDTFHSNINFNTIQLITDSSVRVCSVDTAGGAVVSVCDTINIGGQQIAYFYQNGLRNIGNNIVEFGGNTIGDANAYLNHNTSLFTGYYVMDFAGRTVYDYPYKFRNIQSWQNSTGIASFTSDDDVENTVSLGINYFSHPYGDGVSGYIAPYKGYSIGGNVTGNGSYGLRYQDSTSKTAGIFIHTKDTANDNAVTIYGVPIVNQYGSLYLNANLADYKIASFNTNKNIVFYGYDSSTRNDGVLTKALGTDEFGNVILGTVNGGGTDGVNVGRGLVKNSTNDTVLFSSFPRSNISINGQSSFIQSWAWTQQTADVGLLYTDGTLLFNINDTLFSVGGFNGILTPSTTDSIHYSTNLGRTWSNYSVRWPYSFANITTIKARYPGDWNYIFGETGSNGNRATVIRFKDFQNLQTMTTTAEYGDIFGFGAEQDQYGNLYVLGGQVDQDTTTCVQDVWMSTAQSGGANWTKVQDNVSWLGGCLINQVRERNGFIYVLKAGDKFAGGGGVSAYTNTVYKIAVENIYDKTKWVQIDTIPNVIGLFTASVLFKGSIIIGLGNYNNVNRNVLSYLDNDDKWHELPKYIGIDSTAGVIAETHATDMIVIGESAFTGIGSGSTNFYRLKDTSYEQPHYVQRWLGIRNSLYLSQPINSWESIFSNGVIGSSVTGDSMTRIISTDAPYEVMSRTNGVWWGILNSGNSTQNANSHVETGRKIHLDENFRFNIYTNSRQTGAALFTSTSSVTLNGDNADVVLYGTGYNLIGYLDGVTSATFGLRYHQPSKSFMPSTNGGFGKTRFWSQNASPSDLGRTATLPDGSLSSTDAFFPYNADADSYRILGYRTSLPTTGTWDTGDEFLYNGTDTTIAAFRCTLGGTPGTWKTIRSGNGAGITAITADNGLTASTSTNVQLGGTLLQPTTINSGGFQLVVTGSVASSSLQVTNFSSGGAISGATLSASNSGVFGSSEGTFGAIQAQTTAGIAFYANLLGSTNNTVQTAIKIARQTPGTAANGVGASIDFYSNTTSSFQLANQLISKWADATDATRTSQFIITGVNSAATNNLLILKGDGTVNIPTNVQNFANNAAAITGGLAVGDLYRNGDALQIVH